MSSHSRTRPWSISPLSDVPQFADDVAGRGWAAWWRHDGMSLATYRAGLEPMMQDGTVPLALVAHRGREYLGSVLLIENDLETRPNLKPWVAALWVDEAARGQGIAADLVRHARAKAATLGIARVYLCAKPYLRPYYLAQGWQQVELDVEGLDVFAIGTP